MNGFLNGFFTDLLDFKSEHDFPLKFLSRYQLKNKIRTEFIEFQSNTTSLLAEVNFICLTTDIWGTKHRSYLGVTCHYLDINTFKRQSLALGCSRFYSPHTNDNIAEEIQMLYARYGLDGRKIVATVTDNASNFVKAFREFGSPDINEYGDSVEQLSEDSGENTSDENSDEIYFHELQGIRLSKHIRCASHTLNLIATTDAANAQTNSVYARIFVTSFKKLNSLWNKTQRPKSSETIRQILSSGLGRPGQTRWNAVSIVEILKKDPKKLNDLMIEFGIEPFTSTERLFLNEFADAMAPIAAALNNLQKSNCHYGILLPTLFATISQLENHIQSEKFKYCTPLVIVLLDGLISRFANIIDFSSQTAIPALISTCTHPYFKLGWLGKHKTAKNVDEITTILLKAAKEVRLAETSNKDSDGKQPNNTFKQSRQYRKIVYIIQYNNLKNLYFRKQ